MKVGLSMLFCLGKPFSSVLEGVNEFGVDCIELVDESIQALNSKRVNILKRIASKNNLEFTVHAPFADINIASTSPMIRRVMLKKLEKSLHYARQLGSRQWVFHSGWKSGVNEFSPHSDWRTNLNSICTLLSVANKLELEISIENPPEPMNFLVKRIQDFDRLYKELGRNIGLTLDVAHAHTTGEEFKFIKKFSDKITHVHVSDNEGKYDAHLGIGYGNIDWKTFAGDLNRIGYKGKVILESVSHVQESLETMRRLFR